MDDNQWVIPRQKGEPYDVSESELFIKAVEEMKKYLHPFPITLFLVGVDMKVDKKAAKIKELLNAANVELANHSFTHNNDFDRLSVDEKKREIIEAENIIKHVFGVSKLQGYRSPGYLHNKEIVEILMNSGYAYDASLIPSFYGPLFRRLNFLLNGVRGTDNFGRFSNGYLPNEPFKVNEDKSFVQMNVSVCPFFRFPIHYSMIGHVCVYKMLSGLMKRIQYLSFVFHLYDFLNVDSKKMKCVLNMITALRDVKLSREICQLVA